MANKWVDNNAYLGPDRRRTRGSRLLRERRKGDESSDPPPLNALLRRTRVSLLGMTSQQDKERTIQFVRAAMEVSDRLGHTACTAQLREVWRALSIVDPKNHDAVSKVDTLLQQAMTLI